MNENGKGRFFIRLIKAFVGSVTFFGVVIGIVANWTTIASFWQSRQETSGEYEATVERTGSSTKSNVAEARVSSSEETTELVLETVGNSAIISSSDSETSDGNVSTEVSVETSEQDEGLPMLDFTPVMKVNNSHTIYQYIITKDGTIYWYNCDGYDRMIFSNKGFSVNAQDYCNSSTAVDLVYDRYKDTIYVILGIDVYVMEIDDNKLSYLATLNNEHEYGGRTQRLGDNGNSFVNEKGLAFSRSGSCTIDTNTWEIITFVHYIEGIVNNKMCRLGSGSTVEFYDITGREEEEKTIQYEMPGGKIVTFGDNRFGNLYGVPICFADNGIYFFHSDGLVYFYDGINDIVQPVFQYNTDLRGYLGCIYKNGDTFLVVCNGWFQTAEVK